MSTKDHQIQLILTGGTMSMSRNAEGLLVPSGESLDNLAEKIGFGVSAKPYIIDSIDLDIDHHYPLLRDTVIKALEKHQTPVICGGTDTLIWYSSLLTKDMMRRGFLQDGSNQKIIFLSSMRPIEDAPQLVERIMEAGKALVSAPISGGFAISASSRDTDKFIVHDVTNHFDKISASLVDALRSDREIGYVQANQFHASDYYQRPATPETQEHIDYSRVAPPLLKGHKSEMVLAYLKTMGLSQPPFDALIIEGLPGIDSKLDRNDQVRLVETVEWLKQMGTKVIFCNPIYYDEHQNCMRPAISPDRWDTARLRKELEGVGASFRTALTKDVYIDRLMAHPGKHPDLPTRRLPDSMNEPRTQKVLGIRYVPVHSVMEQTIDSLVPKVKNLVFSALPGGVMPDAVVPALQRNSKSDRHFLTTFQYNGHTYKEFDDTTIVEGAHNAYAAGQGTGLLVTQLPTSDSAVMNIYKGRVPRPVVATR